MSVTREILGVKEKAKAPKSLENLLSSMAPVAKPKTAPAGKKQSREIASLLKGEEKQNLEIPKKERIGWIRYSFENPARGDAFKLTHWEKKKFPRPPGYAGSQAAVPFPLPDLPADLKFPGWSHAELLELWNTCRETEMRFAVVGDRIGKSVEEIKTVFFTISKNLEIPGYKARGVFDVAAERQRRELSEEKFSGNFKVPEQLKQAQADLKNFKDSAAEAQRLLADPNEISERRNFQVWLSSEEKPETLGARVAKLRCVEAAHRRLRTSHKLRFVDLEISRYQELQRNLKNFIKQRELEIASLSNKM